MGLSQRESPLKILITSGIAPDRKEKVSENTCDWRCHQPLGN